MEFVIFLLIVLIIAGASGQSSGTYCDTYSGYCFDLDRLEE